MTAQDGFDLTELDAKSIDLDLLILPALEHERSIHVETAQIAGAIGWALFS